MIFSRTITEADADELEVQNNVIDYLQLPSSTTDYKTTLLKFWEYSLLFKMISEYGLSNEYVLNIVVDKPDDALQKLCDSRNLKLTQLSFGKFLKLQVKPHRYGIICGFGVLEYVPNEYIMVDKICKHITLDGYMLLTTDNTDNTNKKRIIDVDDLVSMSCFLEHLGYDFCSEETDLVSYTNKSNLHSLAMKRLGN